MDTLLLGPLGTDQPFRAMVLDLDGLSTPMHRREAEVFAAFLHDEGYANPGTIYVSDGKNTYAVPAGHHGWHAVTAPEGLRLQRLLNLCNGNTAGRESGGSFLFLFFQQFCEHFANHLGVAFTLGFFHHLTHQGMECIFVPFR